MQNDRGLARRSHARECIDVDADGSSSFGVALLDPEVDALESIDRADHALTLAKAAGRNRVIVWDPSVTTGVRLRQLELKDVEG